MYDFYFTTGLSCSLEDNLELEKPFEIELANLVEGPRFAFPRLCRSDTTTALGAFKERGGYCQKRSSPYIPTMLLTGLSGKIRHKNV